MTDKTERWLANAILGIYDTSVTPAQLDEAIAAIELYAAAIRAECAEVARNYQPKYGPNEDMAVVSERIATAIESVGESKAMERDDG